MTKWDLSALEQQISDLQDLVAKVTEVNAAQAEQLRKAQERIRAAEAERDHANAMLICERAKWDALHDELESVEAQRDRAWNEAIKAACKVIDRERKTILGDAAFLTDVPFSKRFADAIRSLAKEAGE
jgi:chromosome segregation ATPase